MHGLLSISPDLLSCSFLSPPFLPSLPSSPHLLCKWQNLRVCACGCGQARAIAPAAAAAATVLGVQHAAISSRDWGGCHCKLCNQSVQAGQELTCALTVTASPAITAHRQELISAMTASASSATRVCQRRHSAQIGASLHYGRLCKFCSHSTQAGTGLRYCCFCKLCNQNVHRGDVYTLAATAHAAVTAHRQELRIRFRWAPPVLQQSTACRFSQHFQIKR
eukprot:scaffold295836_cov23-Tisochrysis_lutea.AAC.1